MFDFSNGYIAIDTFHIAIDTFHIAIDTFHVSLKISIKNSKCAMRIALKFLGIAICARTTCKKLAKLRSRYFSVALKGPWKEARVSKETKSQIF